MIQMQKTPILSTSKEADECRPRRPLEPELVFSAKAWLKLQFLCHIGDTEIGAFAISSADDSLYIEDLAVVPQLCSSVSVGFNDEAVADFFDAQIDAGRRPDQFARIWLHTHPGDSPHPTGTDIETFQRVFGRCAWAIMFILACGGDTYCELRVNAGTSGALPERSITVRRHIPVRVDYASLVTGNVELDFEGWLDEYLINVAADPAGSWLQGIDDANTSGAKSNYEQEPAQQAAQDRTHAFDGLLSEVHDPDASIECLVDLWADADSGGGGGGGGGGCGAEEIGGLVS